MCRGDRHEFGIAAEDTEPGDLVARGPSGHVRAHVVDDTGELVAQDLRERDRGARWGPSAADRSVGDLDTRRKNPHQNLTLTRGGDLDVSSCQRIGGAEGVDRGRAHRAHAVTSVAAARTVAMSSTLRLPDSMTLAPSTVGTDRTPRR